MKTISIRYPVPYAKGLATFLVSLLISHLSSFAQGHISQDVRPFTIKFESSEIIQLKDRIAAMRWPDQVDDSDWNYGANLAYMKELADYWATDFNWELQEERLNQYPNYQVTIDDYDIHFVYEPGEGGNRIPLVLLHGWPSTFYQMQKIIPLLTSVQKDANGNSFSFDVIVPSLIGYGFSERSQEVGMTVFKMADLFQQLMVDKLNYDTFVLRGSDIGAGVAKEWALSYPENVMGLHLSGSNPYAFQTPSDLTEAEQAYLQAGQQFMMEEGAYAMEQSTKPQTAAYGLNDSPIGLAAWIVEKYQTWSDNGGDVENCFSKDDLITILNIYWFTQTIGSSMRVYYESSHNWSPNANQKVEVPTAMLMLEQDIAVAPREWEARTYNIVRWNTHPSGGHFGEWEKPELTASDIRAFTSSLIQ
jgi:pimeloyl-ACP methyl ester carboxylesterase